MSEKKGMLSSYQPLLMVAMICGTVIYAIVEFGKRPAPGPVAPVVSDWQSQLTDSLRGEQNEERVVQLRNLWAGFAELVPKEAKSIVAVERMNKLAGSIAVSGLGPRNPAATKIVQEQFRLLAKEITDPLDDRERERIRVLFQRLSESAGAAL